MKARAESMAASRSFANLRLRLIQAKNAHTAENLLWGGDAPLLAGILTAQIAAAALTLPLVVAFGV